MVAERHQGMSIYSLATADWRVRLLARLTCAPYRPTTASTSAGVTR